MRVRYKERAIPSVSKPGPMFAEEAGTVIVIERDLFVIVVSTGLRVEEESV